MPKATKVISGTSTTYATIYLDDAVFSTVYTVPTGKVARIEILLGSGIRTSDGSINLWMISNTGVTAWVSINPSWSTLLTPGSNLSTTIPVNYTFATGPGNSGYNPLSLVRNVTYLKAGGVVEVPGGMKYNILVVEEDAG
jgi:hypothetical protein